MIDRQANTLTLQNEEGKILKRSINETVRCPIEDVWEDEKQELKKAKVPLEKQLQEDQELRRTTRQVKIPQRFLSQLAFIGEEEQEIETN